MHILYHDDFDGAASAAILTAALQHGDIVVETYRPVDHDLRAIWERPGCTPTSSFAVVDFTYHTRAGVWFDHHGPTSFLSDEHRAHYLGRQSDWCMWNPAFRSCAALVQAQMNRGADLQMFEELVDAANIVDSAGYQSADHFFDGTAAYLDIDAAWRQSTAGQKIEVIRGLATGDLEQALAPVQTLGATAREQQRKALDLYPAVMRRLTKVVFTNLVESPLPFLRYAPFYYYPSAYYAVSVWEDGPLTRISLSKNPWLDIVHLDLGALASQVGGGGHPYAAGASFPDRAQALGISQRWVALLQERG